MDTWHIFSSPNMMVIMPSYLGYGMVVTHGHIIPIHVKCTLPFIHVLGQRCYRVFNIIRKPSGEGCLQISGHPKMWPRDGRFGIVIDCWRNNSVSHWCTWNLTSSKLEKPPSMLGLYQPSPTKCLEDLANQESILLPLTRRFMSSMQNRKAHGCGSGILFSCLCKWAHECHVTLPKLGFARIVMYWLAMLNILFWRDKAKIKTKTICTHPISLAMMNSSMWALVDLVFQLNMK